MGNDMRNERKIDKVIARDPLGPQAIHMTTTVGFFNTKQLEAFTSLPWMGC